MCDERLLGSGRMIAFSISSSSPGPPASHGWAVLPSALGAGADVAQVTKIMGVFKPENYLCEAPAGCVWSVALYRMSSVEVVCARPTQGSDSDDTPFFRLQTRANCEGIHAPFPCLGVITGVCGPAPMLSRARRGRRGLPVVLRPWTHRRLPSKAGHRNLLVLGHLYLARARTTCIHEAGKPLSTVQE